MYSPCRRRRPAQTACCGGASSQHVPVEVLRVGGPQRGRLHACPDDAVERPLVGDDHRCCADGQRFERLHDRRAYLLSELLDDLALNVQGQRAVLARRHLHEHIARLQRACDRVLEDVHRHRPACWSSWARVNCCLRNASVGGGTSFSTPPGSPRASNARTFEAETGEPSTVRRSMTIVSIGAEAEGASESQCFIAAL